MVVFYLAQDDWFHIRLEWLGSLDAHGIEDFMGFQTIKLMVGGRTLQSSHIL